MVSLKKICNNSCIFLKCFIPCTTCYLFYNYSLFIFKTGMMYIIRDIFRLNFGHYRDAKGLVDEVRKKNMMPQSKNFRLLTDFTGDNYRLIFELGYDSLAD